MATAWYSEDWGTIYGTSGATGSWFQWPPSALFGTDATLAAMVKTDSVGTWGCLYLDAIGSAANAAGTALRACGSQVHIVGHKVDSAEEVTNRFYTLIGSASSGTKLYAAHSYAYSGTGTSFLGFFTDDGATVGTGTTTMAPQHWTGFSGGTRGTLCVAHSTDGTWTISWTAPRGGSSGSHDLTYAAGTEYAPMADSFIPVIGGRRASSSTPYVDVSSWESQTDEPETILFYVGTWRNGSYGTYQWGSNVIGYPSRVADRAYLAGETGGWASTVTVTLSDALGSWGAFAGTSTAIYEGTWTLQRYWSGSWVRLLTGFVEPENVAYNYAERTVTLRIDSIIARLAQKTAPYDGTSAPGDSVITTQIGMDGTIAAVDAETGTVRIYRPDHWTVETNCYMWSAVGAVGENVRVGSSLTPPDAAAGTGTIVLRSVPEWVVVGAPVYFSSPWPCYVQRAASTASQAYDRVGDVLYTMGFGSGGNHYGMTSGEWRKICRQLNSSPVSPNYRAYGGERLSDILRGLMDATAGLYSVDPTGTFRCRCLLPSRGSAGTVDFEAAYDSDWDAEYEQPYRSVQIDCDYNPETGSYRSRVRAGGTTWYGVDKTYRMPWLGSSYQAQSLCNRIYSCFSRPRARLSLRLPGEQWSNYMPGESYSVTNLPAHLGSLLGSSTTMVLYARIYDYASDLVELELVSQPSGNWAYWDADPPDTWGGGGKVWF